MPVRARARQRRRVRLFILLYLHKYYSSSISYRLESAALRYNKNLSSTIALFDRLTWYSSFQTKKNACATTSEAPCNAARAAASLR